VGIEKCINCGNCTAICPLSADGHAFPRNAVRMAQVGLKDRLRASLDPWLCYYCGECSATCPRGAEPGETLMAARRWLTAAYDWTGLGRRFYTSPAWEVGAILAVGGLVALLFVLFHGPVVTDRVELNTFAPVAIVHLLDWIMAGGLSFFLLTNLWRMHRFVMGSSAETRPAPSLYWSEAWQLVYQFFTQERFSKCEDTSRWVSHLLLVGGYVLMLVLIVGFLPWFQTDKVYPLSHPQRWLGYIATLLIFYGAGAALWGRIRRAHPMHHFSHLSDWIFPILLLLGAISGILVHVFRYMELPWATYSTYVLHLALMVPMLMVEVPFGKWAHLVYRPVAIYFQAVKDRVTELSEAKAALVPTA
jgi:ferredoxin